MYFQCRKGGIMIYKHREIFNRLSIKTGMVFGKISLTPNQWTIISLLPAYAWIFLYFCGSFTTTYAKAAAKEKDLVKEELKGGFLERAERLAILFAGIVLAVFSETYLVHTIILLAVLTNISALQRVLAAWKLSKLL